MRRVRVAAAGSALAPQAAPNPRTKSLITSNAASPGEFTRHFQSPMLAMVCNDSASSLPAREQHVHHSPCTRTDVAVAAFRSLLQQPLPVSGSALVQSLYFPSRIYARAHQLPFCRLPHTAFPPLTPALAFAARRRCCHNDLEKRASDFAAGQRFC